MNDQHSHWEALHRDTALRRDVAITCDVAITNEAQITAPSAFAREVLATFLARADLLELGCGPGDDSAYFVRAGHRATATDFSRVILRRASARYMDLDGLSFVVADTGRPLGFAGGSFDVVYASLSLHYFTDAVTRAIFAEIARVLRAGGLLCFVCKSVRDRLYGQGRQIEPGMFAHEGHVRHFFDEGYARRCLAPRFDVERLWTGDTTFYGEPSAFVKAVARKRG